MATIKIAEIYQSIQGEGRLTGAESVFVRVSGCNLRCWFCDTPYASWKPDGRVMELDAIIEEIEEFGVQHVVLTGGEPMLYSSISELTRQLKELGYHITIETAGTVFQPVECDLMSISPKLANSDPSEEKAGNWAKRHRQDRNNPEVIERLADGFDCQFKFVVDQPEDLGQVDDFLVNNRKVSNHEVWMMPQGTDPDQLTEKEKWLAPLCRKKDWKLCSRKHIQWFGFQRGV